MKKSLLFTLAICIIACTLTACGPAEYASSTTSGTEQNINDTKTITDKLTVNQATPTDIEYSLERYNLIRRTYWVNGMTEKANTLPCPVQKPLGYITLFAGNAIVASYVVDGKVSSLNSFLSPSYVERATLDGGQYGGGNFVIQTELADTDGSYGSNDNGIFFFTIEGQYHEWSGDYHYSSEPLETDRPIVYYMEG